MVRTMITRKDPTSALLDHAPLRISVVASGAGAGIQKRLWDVPGISAVLVEGNFPYSMDATDTFLGFKPERYCSARTAVEMAMQCYYRAFIPGGPKTIGLGVSASVSSVKAHRGEHRVYAAWFSDHGCRVHERVLEKANDPSTLARLQDGHVTDAIGIRALLEAVGEPFPDAPEVHAYDATDIAYDAFWAHPVFTRGGQRVSLPDAKVDAIFPGAFNPPHHGHFGMAKGFFDVAHLEATFHITAVTPHKALLTVADMLQRAKMLEGHQRMFTRNDPLYVDKAERFPTRPIILGGDALERMLDPKWGPTPAELSNAFARTGTHLYVPETRLMGGRELKTSDLTLPPGLVVKLIPGRWDISSSELRAKATSSNA